METQIAGNTKDIVLDSEAFKTAYTDLKDLANDISALREDINEALDELNAGFDTPAGNKFVNSCRNILLDQLDKQGKAVAEVSDTLKQAIKIYITVFNEYKELNNKLKKK